MKALASRLRRQLTYANVIASVAVFLALGGVGYAATKINGSRIVKHSIGAGKLKNHTLGSKQVKADSLTGNVIDESTLKIVPQAQTAVSASTATSAETAKSAETATNAKTAQSATLANNAEDAETLEGLTAEDLEVSCPAGTELFGGMCWEEDPRPAKLWIVAAVECGELGGRLPTLSELVAYIAQSGTQLGVEGAWVSDVVAVDAGSERGLPLAVEESADDGLVSEDDGTHSHGYRCLYYRTN